MALGQTTQAKRLVLLLWILVAFFYFYLAYDYIRVTSNDRQFNDYLQHVVQLAGNEGRSSKEIRDLLVVKAEELALPITREQIQVRNSGGTLDITVNYAADIEIPLLRREVYTKRFEHTVRYQGPR
jgi:hypothetical protein